MGILDRIIPKEREVTDDHGRKMPYRIGLVSVYSDGSEQQFDEGTRNELHQCVAHGMKTGQIFKKGEFRPKKLVNDLMFALVFFVPLGTAAALSEGLLPFIGGGLGGEIATVVGVIVVMVVCLRIWVSLAVEKDAEKIANVLVRHGYCGACGYEMEGTVDDDAWYKICSECGARWYCDRVGTEKSHDEEQRTPGDQEKE